MLKLLSRSINVYVQFFISQFRLSQIQPLGLSKIQLSGLSQIARPTLKIHNNEEEDEPQGKSTHTPLAQLFNPSSSPGASLQKYSWYK